MVYVLVDGKKIVWDKLLVEIKIGWIFVIVFDDMGGLVCILCFFVGFIICK